MKNIDRSFTTIKKMVCPFCSFGCEFGVVLDDFGVRGIEYLKEGNNQGRLCARGSASALYLNHPKRLTYPVKNGKPSNWQTVEKELKQIIKKPENVALTFDRNITIDEYQLLIDFCAKQGIKTIASTYLEPESFLRQFFAASFSLKKIEQVEVIVVVGDLFNQSPMISKSLINWKLSDRKHQLIVVDSMNTHTAGFASEFLRVKLGTEPLILLALAREKIDNFEANTGIPLDRLDAIGQALKKADNGLIIATLAFAHTYDPVLLTEALKHLSDFSGKEVVPFVEFPGFDGNQHFGAVLDLIKKKKIKHIINFGELFPYYYPQLTKSLKAASIYATSTLKYQGYTMLPAALNLEKQGTVLTTFGQKTLTGAIAPASGTRTVAEIIDAIEKSGPAKAKLKAPEVKVDVKTGIEQIIEKSQKEKSKKTLKLIGEKNAYYFNGFFETECIKLNPIDLETFGVKANEMVTIKSHAGTVDLKVRVSSDVGPGFAAVPAETPEVKGIFDFEIKDNIINFIPTEVEIWRKG